ncbi:hypothetical protein NC651_020888 [Populus alba x Populus x berolinensis]|uniref:Uncharacterized protein n=1 Tax=Populus alba x Populus x berolinensis TaxID=444605 RepID=A0AAD6MPT1_9ROSI|nr:hypothetical protein NC651_020888 [Populus alba x Populus x berolinensis]KAJ6988545.1 hypothetical protein NC653_021457 [Populus alba x Populus x berolinensis]
MVRPRGCAQFSHQELKREDREGLKAGVVVIYKAAKRGEGAWRGASLTKPFTQDKWGLNPSLQDIQAKG